MNLADKVVIFSVFICCSCTIIDSNINPQYYESIAKDIGKKGKGTIKIHPFANETSLDFQGSKKSILGFATSKIYTQFPPEILIRDALKTELIAMGYKIQDNQAQFEIFAKLHQYFVEPKIDLLSTNFYGVVELEVAIIENSHHNSQGYKRHFFSQRAIYTPPWSTSLPIALDGIYMKTLERTTQKLMAQVVPAIADLLLSKKGKK